FVNPRNAGGGTVVAPESAIGKGQPETKVQVAGTVQSGAKDHVVLLEIGAIDPGHDREGTAVDAYGGGVGPGINSGSAGIGIGISQEINSKPGRPIGFGMAGHKGRLFAARKLRPVVFAAREVDDPPCLAQTVLGWIKIIFQGWLWLGGGHPNDAA